MYLGKGLVVLALVSHESSVTLVSPNDKIEARLKQLLVQRFTSTYVSVHTMSYSVLDNRGLKSEGSRKAQNTRRR